MECHGAAGHLTSETTRSEYKIINNLCAPLAVHVGDLRPFAKGALVAANLDLPVGPYPLGLPPLARPYTAPPYCLAGANENFIPLVIKVGALIDVFKVLEGELNVAPL